MAKKKKIDNTYKRYFNSKKFELIDAFKVNDSFLIGVFKGTLSPLDIVIRYRVKDCKKTTGLYKGWSNQWQPKHIHWTVDMLIKMSHYPNQSKKLISLLNTLWDNTRPNKNKDELIKATNISKWLEVYYKENIDTEVLNSKGTYSLRFLLSIAKLLMQQEKNNKADAYMFKNLLMALEQKQSTHSIVSIATHKKRK